MIKTKYYMSILLLSIPAIVFAQNVVPILEFGKFRSASSISINPAGIVFVIDEESNEVIKLDTLGNELNRVGGYGWDSYSFDLPADLFTSTLNVYIADKNNDRIQIYDKDLNFLSSFTTKEDEDEHRRFRYPTGVAIYSQGDMFILDSDNSRILKFDLRGDFLTTIGGIENGGYLLTNPKKFTVLQNGNLIVLDGENIVYFDQFGNHVNHYGPGYETVNINSLFDIVTITSNDTIYFGKITDQQPGNSLNKFSPGVPNQIKDAIIFNAKLYLLISKQIYVYQLIE